jgi:uncharacterized protein YhaN
MQIKEAIIGQFGKLQNRNISFEPGINVIYGENEAGKTTLHDFLLGMFFGMEKGRGRGTLNSMYQKHEPWHAPSYYSGAVRFLVDGKPFYLERNFYYKDKKDILKNEADGEELSVVYGDLSILLGGIDKETFGNTYDIPQTGAVTGKELADILSEYLSNAAEGGGANIQVQKAKAALTARKKELAQEVRIIHEQKNEDIRQLIVEKDLLERDARGLHANIADAEREINQLKRVRVEEIGEKRKRLSEQKRQQADRRERQENAPHKREIDGAMQPEKEHPDRMAGIGICASALLVNIAVHYVTSYPSRLFFILQAVFFAGMILCGLYVGISHVIEKAKKEAYLSAQKNEMKAVTQETYADAGLRQAERMLLSLKESLSEKETRRYNIMQDLEAAKQPGGQEKELLEDIRALELAAAEIDRLAKEYYEDSLDGLGSAVSKWMSQLTAGKYDHAIVKEDGKLLILADGKEILPEALSHGTLEQIYLAFRLAVGEIVTKEEPMPVIFDEAFGMYDEKRLMQTLRALDCQIRKEQGRQILIFTCQKREMELLEQSGITYHKIVLE